MSALRGQPPYGFHVAAGRLVINDAEAATRRRMFVLFIEHQKKGTVAKLLNEEGHRTRRGALWRDVQVMRHLACPSAIGRYPAGKTRRGDDGNLKELDPKDWEILSCPPIVTDETWNRVQAILRDQNESAPARAGSHAFSGLLVCQCGGKFQLPSRSPKFVCARCQAKIPVSDLDQAFASELKTTLKTRLQTAPAKRSQEFPLDLDELARRWPKLALPERQKLARFLLDKILVRGETLEFSYRISDSLRNAPDSQQTENPTKPASLVASGEPEWIRLPKSGERCKWTGLTKPALGHLIYPCERNGFKPPVKSKSLKKPGQSRGVRLVHWASLKAYLESPGS